jgi:hypothetical protein
MSDVSSSDVTRTVHVDAGKTLQDDALRASDDSKRGSIVTPKVEAQMHAQTSEALVIDYVERLVKSAAMWAGDIGSNLGSPPPYGLGSDHSSTWRALRARLEAGERVGQLAIVLQFGKPYVLFARNVDSNTMTHASTPAAAASSNGDLSLVVSFVEGYLASKQEQKAFVNSVGGEVGGKLKLGADRSIHWRTLRDRLVNGDRVGRLIYENHGDVNASFIRLQTIASKYSRPTIRSKFLNLAERCSFESPPL